MPTTSSRAPWPLIVGSGLALVWVSGCGSPPPPVPEANRAMAQRLDGLRERADPRIDLRAAQAFLDRFDVLPPSEGSEAFIRDEFVRSQLLLAIGRTEEAIAGFEVVTASDAPGSQRGRTSEARSLLAIAYLRLAEQRHCLDSHNSDSCLLPIRESGVHADPTPARKAAAHYLDILDSSPEDALSQWLLNVASMVAGDYPDRVPDRWLVPARKFASEGRIERFLDVASDAGLDVLGLSGGVVVEDLDNDGLLDVMTSSWGLGDPLRIFKNVGGGSFVDVTASSGLSGITGGLNLVHADYDNDGLVDVLVLRGAWLAERGRHPNSLLRNRGNLTFEDVTVSAGVLDEFPTQTAAWADYDGDGWLDLFVGAESTAGSRHRSMLYRNRADGSFEEVSRAVGLRPAGYVKGCVWGDYDNDGRPDLYVSRLGGDNQLWRNDGPDDSGTWRFTEVAAGAGVTEPRHGFATWFFDYDNDGWLDLFAADYPPDGLGARGDGYALSLVRGTPPQSHPRLYRNRGDGTFADLTSELGLDQAFYAMGSNYGDLDNDGWLDFYLGTGAPDYRSLMPNRMFRNLAGRGFEEVTAAGGFGHLQKGHGVAFADLDQDGDQDVYAVMGGAFAGDVYRNALFRNPGNGNHWIGLRLQGRSANRSAIGARLRLVLPPSAGAARETHHLVATGGSFGSSPLQRHAGLGAADHVDRIEVLWPGKSEPQVFEDLSADRLWLLVEGDPRPRALGPSAVHGGT